MALRDRLRARFGEDPPTTDLRTVDRADRARTEAKREARKQARDEYIEQVKKQRREAVKEQAKQKLKEGLGSASDVASDGLQTSSRSGLAAALQKAKAAAGGMELAQPSQAPTGDGDTADVARRAERAATANAPVDATLDPVSGPEQVQDFARAGMNVDQLVTGPPRQDTGRRDGGFRVDELVTGGRRDEPGMADLVTGSPGGPTVADMVTGTGERERDDDDWLDLGYDDGDDDEWGWF